MFGLNVFFQITKVLLKIKIHLITFIIEKIGHYIFYYLLNYTAQNV